MTDASRSARLLRLFGWGAPPALGSPGPTPTASPTAAIACTAVSDLVRVALVENEPSAELAVGYLRTEGIPAIWRGTSLGATSLVTSVGGALGPMEILVHPEHAERAQELLAERD